MGRSGDLPRGAAPAVPGDDTGCPILHVDMDAFFASVEVVRRPELAGRPVIVGGTGPRGVVSSASYPARERGVRSAMPVARALRLCPHAVLLPPDLGRYRQVSHGIMEIFRSVTPLVQPVSLDEAFLDVGGARRMFGRPAEIGRLVRERIRERFALTCSVGVAETKFLAKIASARCKPDGLLVVPRGAAVRFLHPLPASALWGVGERTALRLAALGLHTIGDVAAAPEATLRVAVGAAAATQLRELAAGRDGTPVRPETDGKSVGADETFDHDIDDPGALDRELLRLAERSAARLRAGGHLGRTITVKIRFGDFTTIHRSRTLAEATSTSDEIYQVARQLFWSAVAPGTPIRLLGVRAEGLTTAGATARQLQLGARERGWSDADRAVDRVTHRFGASAVGRATLLPEPQRREARPSAPDPAGPRPSGP